VEKAIVWRGLGCSRPSQIREMLAYSLRAIDEWAKAGFEQALAGEARGGTAELGGRASREKLDLACQSTSNSALSDTPSSILVAVSSRVTRGTWPEDGPATDLRHGANARR
jgi:hypothetical protein